MGKDGESIAVLCILFDKFLDCLEPYKMVQKTLGSRDQDEDVGENQSSK